MTGDGVALEPTAKLRILSAARPHTAVAERVVRAPFARVWATLGDLERGVPRFEPGVRAVDVVERDGECLRVRAHLAGGRSLYFDAELRPGWCLMWSADSEIGMAACPLTDATTRVAHMEGLRGLGRWLRPLIRCKLRFELWRLARLVEKG